MLISELAERSGLPIATLKFYIRQGMLPPGAATSATRAEYGDEHLARLRVIAALADARGLPLSRVKDILTLIDDPDPDPISALGKAVSALPPYVDEGRDDFPLAKEAIEVLGLTYDSSFTAVPQLDDAIRALKHAELDTSPETLRRYADAMRMIAVDEIAPISDMSRQEAVAYSVLGTALYEPLMLALRRLEHQHLLATGASAGQL